MSLSTGNVNFLGLTKTGKKPQPQNLAQKIQEIGETWEREAPQRVFNASADFITEGASHKEALKQLQDVGFKAFYKEQNEFKEIEHTLWDKGMPLEDKPSLRDGLNEGLYKLAKIETKLDAGYTIEDVQNEYENAVWDSSSFDYSEIKAKTAEIEERFKALREQQAQILGKDRFDEIMNEVSEEIEIVDASAQVKEPKEEENAIKHGISRSIDFSFDTFS